MTDYPALFASMREYRIVKVVLSPEGQLLEAISAPPEGPSLAHEDLDPKKIKEEAERIMFAAVEG